MCFKLRSPSRLRPTSKGNGDGMYKRFNGLSLLLPTFSKVSSEKYTMSLTFDCGKKHSHLCLDYKLGKMNKLTGIHECRVSKSIGMNVLSGYTEL